MSEGATIDLRLGDALGPDGLAALQDDAVDCAILDPPFDERTHAAALESGDWRAGDRRVAGALPFAPFGREQIIATAAQLGRLVRRWCLVFAAERQIETWASALELAGMRFVRLGAAVRTNPRPQLSGDRPAPPADWIVIAHATGARKRWRGGGAAASWPSPPARFDTGRKLLHPTQKPLALLRALIEDFTEPAELVLDPFAGSGTCALACAQLGRRFIGWERAEAFHAAALARFEREGVSEVVAAVDARKASLRSLEASRTDGQSVTDSRNGLCAGCGRPLDPRQRADARFHGAACRQRAYRRRRRPAA